MKKVLLLALMALPFFVKAQQSFDPVWYFPNGGYLSDLSFPDSVPGFIFADVSGTVAGISVFGNGQYHYAPATENSPQTYGTPYYQPAQWPSYVIAGLSQPLVASDELDFPATSALTYTELTMTVTGAQVGDIVSCSYPAVEGMFTASVTVADEVTIKYFSVAGNNPAEATFNVMVFPQ